MRRPATLATAMCALVALSRSRSGDTAGCGRRRCIAAVEHRPMRDDAPLCDSLHPRHLGLDGEPQLRRDHRFLAGAVHQFAGRRVRPGDQLPQHQPPEAAQLRRRDVRAPLLGDHPLQVGLQPFSALQHVGTHCLRTRGVVESLRGEHASNCAPADSGEYAVRHNPPPYFTTLSSCSTFDVGYTQLSSDLAGRDTAGILVRDAQRDRRHA